MSGDARSGTTSDLIDWFGEASESTGGPVASGDSMMVPMVDDAFPTMALGKFLDALQLREAPVLLDLGSAVGSNVTFWGEKIGGKVFIEDLFADLDQLAMEHASGKDRDASLQATVVSRITQETDSVDGVLCWDTIEHLTAPVARALAAGLARVLRPGGGVLLTSFGTKQRHIPGHRRYEIVSRSEMGYRFEAGASRQLRVLQSREVIQMFRELTVAESFLLKTHTREMIFRKPTRPS